MKIVAAWFVSMHAVGSYPNGRKVTIGRVLARTEDDLIFEHNCREFVDPGAFVRAVQTRGSINPTLWRVVADDRQASRYFGNMQSD